VGEHDYSITIDNRPARTGMTRHRTSDLVGEHPSRAVPSEKIAAFMSLQDADSSGVGATHFQDRLGKPLEKVLRVSRHFSGNSNERAILDLEIRLSKFPGMELRCRDDFFERCGGHFPAEKKKSNLPNNESTAILEDRQGPRP